MLNLWNRPRCDSKFVSQARLSCRAAAACAGAGSRFILVRGNGPTSCLLGTALLATVGSTALYVGLFGTVWAIYSALVQIGASGQAAAVPAVIGYNWLLRKNKLAFESLRSLGAQLHALRLARTDGSQSALTPVVAEPGASVVSGG